MNELEAISIIEGTTEPLNQTEYYTAWQFMLQTDLCWQLQGFYTREALNLIKLKLISPIVRVPCTEGKADYYVHYNVPFVPTTYVWEGSGIILNGYKDNKGDTLYVWNDSSCEESPGTPYSDYITINDTIIYLRNLQKGDSGESQPPFK